MQPDAHHHETVQAIMALPTPPPTAFVPVPRPAMKKLLLPKGMVRHVEVRKGPVSNSLGACARRAAHRLTHAHPPAWCQGCGCGGRTRAAS